MTSTAKRVLRQFEPLPDVAAFLSRVASDGETVKHVVNQALRREIARRDLIEKHVHLVATPPALQAQD